MTAGQVCLVVAAFGVAELGAAAVFLNKHLTEQRAAKRATTSMVEHGPGHTPMKAKQSLMLAGVALMSALISFGIAAFMWFVVAPKGVDRDRAAAAFLEAARTKDSARLSSLSAPGAALDQQFFANEVAGAKSVEATSYDLAFGGQSCMEFETDKGKTLFLYLEQQSGTWLVVRGGPMDPACDNQLNSD
ncbi:MAG: hypothetical protein H6718_31510 [Polyangiaceae bacterium]|nr:hypothetical protein [Myxococcales bacterium]MCB9589984.1 hypothetical protein [Polyangiaceae bacterium]